MIDLKIKKTDVRAITPTYGSAEAAGLDLYALLDDDILRFEDYMIIPPNGTYVFHTGIAVEIPQGYYGALYARSGLATKEGLVLTTGVSVIDSDYRGEVMVGIRNASLEYRRIYDGQRIAQLVVQPYVRCQIRTVDELAESERGSGGFGSTGV